MVNNISSFLPIFGIEYGLLSPVKREDIGFSFSVCLPGLVSRLYLRNYSMAKFYISHMDRTLIEGVQRRVFVRFDQKL